MKRHSLVCLRAHDVSPGPIVHHNEMLSQFTRLASHRLRSEDLAPGVTIFAIGLFKKLVPADGIVAQTDPVFILAAEQGISLTFFEAWGGSLAWTFRCYFDFSRYSDMANGLARCLRCNAKPQP